MTLPAPHYADDRVVVHHGDCLDVLRAIPDCSVDSVVTDPPAGVAFMGKEWDTDKGGRDRWVAWLSSILAECRRILRPGGHAVVWALPRTSGWTHRAIEDAGLDVRDCITHLFGSGFPKSHNFPGGLGTALKPASEHWHLARKSLDGTVAATVLRHGTGTLRIDACRVGNDRSSAVTGRWPANVILTHASNCGEDCAEGCPVADLDAQSGPLHTQDPETRKSRSRVTGATEFGTGASIEYADPKGSGASRFFPAFRYEAKADSTERPRVIDVAHPTVKPLALMSWLVRLVTPPGGVVLDPFAGSGTTAEACIIEGFRCITIECEIEYLPLILHRITRRTDPVANLTAQARRGEDVDLGLFGLLDEGGAA